MKRVISFAIGRFIAGIRAFYGWTSAATLNSVAHAGIAAAAAKTHAMRTWTY